MRVPVSSSSSPHTNLKPALSNNTTNNTALNLALHSPTPINPTFCYEPNSVLDPCRSPSPPALPEKPSDHSAIIEKPEDSLELDEHVLQNLDWDSIMKDLGLNEGFLKSTIPHPNPCDPQVPSLPEFPSSQDPGLFDPASADFSLSDIFLNQNLGYHFNGLDHLVHEFSHSHNSNGFDLIEVLIRAADCFDSNQLPLAQAILDRLNQRLRSPVGKPLQRAAFYFKDALQSLLSGSNRTPRASTLADIVQSIKTFKTFSEISPIPRFSIFTTNQAVLEALQGSSFMHVIDFDIGLGIQYASLMKEIAACKINAPLLRITALVPEEYAVECKLIRENLNQYALELRIRVQVEFVPLPNFEAVSFKAVKFMDGEKTAVLISPTIFRRLGSTNNIAAFLADVRRVSPSVIVFVDGEGWTEASATTSFRRGLVNSLEFYSMMLESLDASMVVGGGGDWVRRIEMLLLRPKIVEAVEGAGRTVSPWREVFYGAGMRPVQLSQFADDQAECLLAKFQIRGFQVAKRHADLVLFWHERSMVATSAWRC